MSYMASIYGITRYEPWELIQMQTTEGQGHLVQQKTIETRRRRTGEMTRRKGEKSRRRTGTATIRHMSGDSNTTNNAAHGNTTSNPRRR